MKNSLFLLFFAATATTATHAFATLAEGNVGLENIQEPAELPGPFRLEGELDITNSTHFKKKEYEKQKFQFGFYEATAGMAFCYIPKAKEAYAAAVAYRSVNFLWKENPYFDQDHFKQIGLLLRFYSQRFNNWIWQGQFLMNMDVDHWNFNHYTTYDLTVWGRYQYLCNLNLHLGFIVQTGMKIDKVYPIVGFDWEINKCWKLNAVFPVNMSLLYEVNKKWSTGAAIRFFYIRERAGRKEPLPMALASYRNSGCEFVILYNNSPFLEANIHVGSTLGGTLKISDKKNHHAHNLKLDPAAYAGGEIIWSF